MNIKRILKYQLLILCFFGFSNVYSQDIIVNEEPAISRMMSSYVSKNLSEETIRGWRIQIVTTDDRRRMERERSKFLGKYENIPLKWIHESPYYKVQVGAYEKKIDLQAFLIELKLIFPSAIPILDNIKKSELVEN